MTSNNLKDFEDLGQILKTTKGILKRNNIYSKDRRRISVMVLVHGMYDKRTDRFGVAYRAMQQCRAVSKGNKSLMLRQRVIISLRFIHQSCDGSR